MLVGPKAEATCRVFGREKRRVKTCPIFVGWHGMATYGHPLTQCHHSVTMVAGLVAS